MPKYSEQDLEYAAQFRAEIHREALEIVRKTRPNATKVIDRHPVEDYFQENWEYPGKWYTIVSIPYGYKSRQALVDDIVRNTLSGRVPEKESTYTEKLHDMTKAQPKTTNRLCTKPDSDPFYRLISEYSDLVVDYFIVKDERYCGYTSHRNALKTAFTRLDGDWNGDPDKATCKSITTGDKFLSKQKREKLSYRKAFLCPPHGNSYTDSDFERVNAALFPNEKDKLEVYEWSTDWSEYFDEGHEWWGALCLTVYDKTLDRFVIILASATD